MTVRVHCDSCPNTATAAPLEGSRMVSAEGWEGLYRGGSRDNADLCPECFERHWASITKHRRLQEAGE